MHGAQLKKVDATRDNAIRTGNYIHNFLEDDHRVYTNEVDNALAGESEADKRDHQAQLVSQKKQALMQQQQKADIVKENKLNEEMAIHFMDDGYVQTQEESDSDSDSDSD
jgi:hypothetical protein